MAINRISPKKGKVVDIPTVPTIGTATAGGESATVEYTAATVGGPATTFTALSSPGSFTGTGTSPITVTGLTAGTSYTFTVRGSNATGNGEYSVASNSVTPTAANSYESIATVTVGSGGSSSISFSSIPSTYKHLQIRGILRGSRASGNDILGIQFNGDTTSSNYGSHRLIGDGASAAASFQATSTYSSTWASDMPAASATANIFNGVFIDVLDYTNTSKNKVGRSLGGYDANGSGDMYFGSQLWLSTSAVTSITLVPVFGSGFAQYSTFALYGVKG